MKNKKLSKFFRSISKTFKQPKKEVSYISVESKREMCNKTIMSGVCPGRCNVCAWGGTN